MKLLLKTLLILIIFSSCEKQEEQLKIRVNYYKQTVNTPKGPIMALSVQSGTDLGSTNWSPSTTKIAGFVYEPGYIYELLVSAQTIENPYSEFGSTAYVLKQIISRTKIENNATFSLDLKSDNVNYLKGDVSNGFNILNEVNIDCNSLCDDLALAIQSNAKHVRGEFALKDDGSIKLISITND
ncbi:MAG: DUF4377 domain-containing protein [Pedobacter sp.]|nr:MAG: DUF4377 domain-containing protein [Pedobacter sp.]